MAPAVSVVKVAPAEFTETVAVSGSLVPRDEILVAPEVEGFRVLELMVDEGDRVKKGDLLAYISAPEIEYQLAQAEATLAQTKATVGQMLANMELAQITDQRNEPLVERGFVSALNGDTYRLNLKAQEDQVRAAQANMAAQAAQVEVARQQKDYQSVVAPFDGVITQRNVDVGDLMQGDSTSGTPAVSRS